MTIKCATCGRTHQHPFIHCPNCGRALLEVRQRSDDPQSIEFAGSGWVKTYLIQARGKLAEHISNPVLSELGLSFEDEKEHRCFLSPLQLYQQLSEPDRELLVL